MQCFHWIIVSDYQPRTGSAPEPKEEVPGKLKEKTGKLEDKTDKLEKRLLLRQIITKALDVKRNEIAKLAGQGESEQSSNPLSPRKLTFYDVVQLARQQALLEKAKVPSEDVPVLLSDHVSSALTQRETKPIHLSHQAPSVPMPSDDLIDLSDTPEPVLTAAGNENVQHDLDLLDLGESMVPQLSHPSLTAQNASGSLGLDREPAIEEQDKISSQRQSDVDLLGLVEPQAAQAEGNNTDGLFVSAEALQPREEESFQSCKVSIDLDGNADTKPAAIELIDPEEFLADDSDTKEVNTLCASLANADLASAPVVGHTTALVDQGHNMYEDLLEISPNSTASPSIFSHSSSLTSTTGCSLPGITEDEVQARKSSLQNGLKSSSFSQIDSSSSVTKIEINSDQTPLSKVPTHGDGAGQHRNQYVSSTSSLKSPSKPQRTPSEDNVSLSPSLLHPPNLDEPDAQGFPWILKAAREGDEQLIRRLLASGADINAFHGPTRRHALSEAAIHGHQEIVDLLVEERCLVDFPDFEGYTALHHACRRGHLTIAKKLIASGAAINALGFKQQTALHLAIQVPHQSVVMLLIQHQASVNVRDASSRTPLHISASQGNKVMCEYLLNAGAQLDSREAHSKTPLEFACEAGHYELVQSMLNQSKLIPTNMTFLTAFFAAVECGHVRTAECFFDHGLKVQELKQDSHKPAILAAKSSCLAMVELMIQQGCDLNARDEDGWNALHFASSRGHYQIIERLLAGDLSAKAVTSRKETPLHLAVKGGHFAVAERLLRSDEDNKVLSAQDKHGQQAVHYTARDGSVDMFNLLMSNGGKINVENNFGWQPLHIATAYGHLALVERLLQQGANIEEKLGSSSMKKDQTHRMVEEGYIAEARKPYPASRPLHLACEYSQYQIAECLISKGAKLEATCSEGWKPLHHAAYFGSSTLVEMLLQGGVNPHATTNEGKTAQALQFCTSGATIPEEEKERVRNLLKEAVNTVRKQKQKSFKVALKKGSTAEEKNNLVRATTFSTNFVSRPSLHRATTTAQVSDPASIGLEPIVTPHRPRIQHLPHTSPLPLADSQAVSGSHYPLAAQSPASHMEAIPLRFPTTTESILGNVVSEASSKVLEMTESNIDDLASKVSSLPLTMIGTAKSNLNDLTSEVSSSALVAIGTAESDLNDLASESSTKALTAIGAAESNLNNLASEASTKALTAIGTAESNLNNLASETSATAFTAIGAVESNLNNLASEASTTASITIGAVESNLKGLASETSSRALTAISATESNLKDLASEASSKALSIFGVPDPSSPSEHTSTLDAIPASITEDKTSIQPVSKIKRRTTLGLSRAKTGIEIGRLGVSSIGKPAFELRRQTQDIGNKILGLGKQGLEISEQGIEMGKQGLEIGKQGLEMGKQGLEGAMQGFEMGKQSLNFGREGFRKARRFTRPGKADDSERTGAAKKAGTLGKLGAPRAGTRKNRRNWTNPVNENADDQSNLGDDGVNASVGEVAAEDRTNENDENKEEEEGDDDDDDDDAGSVFSLGEFADDGNDDF